MNYADRRDVILNAISIRAGLTNLNSPVTHPHARQSILAGEPQLSRLVELCGEKFNAETGRSNPPHAAGFGTSDFKNALADLIRDVIVRRFTSLGAHRRFCKQTFLPNFMPSKFGTIDLDVQLEERPELGEFRSLLLIADTDGLNANVKTYGTNINVSRAVVLADDIELLAGVSANVGSAASRLESSAVYGLIESNPTLGDGQPMFHNSFSNIEAFALDATHLGSAIGRLRTNPTPTGLAAELDAAFLIVSAEQELAAAKLVHEAGMDNKIAVIASASLPAGRWYVMAAPEQSPVIRLLQLAGSRSGFAIGPAGSKDKAFVTDGTPIGIRFDFGAVPVGRVGIVKGGA